VCSSDLGEITLSADPDFAKRQHTIVYPNPAFTDIKVDIHPKHGALKTLYVYDSKGHLLWSQSTRADFVLIPVDNIPPGMYWLSIREAEKKETFPLSIGIK
jgi:hypothetical protein